MNRKGFAGLIVLVSIAIVMILAMIQMKGMFKPLPKPKEPVIDNERPWLVADEYLDGDGMVELPTEPQPLIVNAIKIEAPVNRKGNPRGDCFIEIDTMGLVKGSWNCTYQYEEKQYTYHAAFGGNVVADRVFVDKDGNKDKSKLFFFTKGKYTQTQSNQTSGSEFDTDGDVYVTGWLKKDYSASGKITITTDEKWSAVYEWESSK